jgi:hypothetical protein
VKELSEIAVAKFKKVTNKVYCAIILL